MDLTVVICTHNRAGLLERTLASLNRAKRPHTWGIEVLVIANACSDTTASFLGKYVNQAQSRDWLPLRYAEETRSGKSRALNLAIGLIKTSAVAFVDDDHRVDEGYLSGVCTGFDKYPEAQLLCGRIIPDWDGSEPQWVHDTGPYRVYPLPVPQFDLGPQPKRVDPGTATPGGGNLCLRSELFARVGGFCVDFGPVGHDLAGAEDIDWVKRAIAQGAVLHYVPEILQYHYVDNTRLTLSYVMRKSFHRSSSTVRVSPETGAGHGVPAYMYRKVASYLLYALASMSASRRRFYCVRFAAALGEIRGVLGQRRREFVVGEGAWGLIAVLPVLLWFGARSTGLFPEAPNFGQVLWQGLRISGLAGALITAILLAKSLYDFTRTGPQISVEVLSHYRWYSVYSLARLGFFSFLVTSGIAFLGVVAYSLAAMVFGSGYHPWAAASAACAAILILTVRLFLRALLYNPGIIAASSQYAIDRFYPIWERLTPLRLRMLDLVLLCGLGAWFVAGGFMLAITKAWGDLSLIGAIVISYAVIAGLGWWNREPKLARRRKNRSMPNIIMIGSDTLRADRLNGYHRKLTPNIERLQQRAVLFENCYVPCARTAPSLLSMLTGTWPHTHGVRDTFVRPENTILPIAALPEILERAGYQTAAVGDWAASDITKFNFGFGHLDVPPDQWNMKYLLRQGPKDIRLFLSLFTQNIFGKTFLPELYYLGGVSLTEEVGRDTRRMAAKLAKKDAPFFLLSFMATNHPPFSSKYPYYTLFADREYRGPSKFAMSKLNDPFEIIRRQGEPKTEFDLDQIINLYDGCVKNFDDEVGRILAYLESSGLSDNTIVIVFSDHGMEFFEHETWGQGNSVIGDFSARVPLVIADPRSPGPTKIPEVVRTVDIAPTLLEMIGLPQLNYMEGTSLFPLVRGAGLAKDLPAFYETGVWLTDLPGTPSGHLRYPELQDLLEVPDKGLGTIAIHSAFSDAIIAAKDRMVRLGDWKLTYQPLIHGAIWRLFNVRQDPECRQDVLDRYPEMGGQLRTLLEQWMAADALPINRYLAAQKTPE